MQPHGYMQLLLKKIIDCCNSKIILQVSTPKINSYIFTYLILDVHYTYKTLLLDL